MAPPPFIPPLEETYDQDVSEGLEVLHAQHTSDELVPTSPDVNKPGAAVDRQAISSHTRDRRPQTPGRSVNSFAEASSPARAFRDPEWQSASPSQVPPPVHPDHNSTHPLDSHQRAQPRIPSRHLTTIYSTGGHNQPIYAYPFPTIPIPTAGPNSTLPITFPTPSFAGHVIDRPFNTSRHGQHVRRNPRQYPSGAVEMASSRSNASRNATDADQTGHWEDSPSTHYAPGSNPANSGVGPTSTEFATLGMTNALSVPHSRQQAQTGYARPSAGPIGQPGPHPYQPSTSTMHIPSQSLPQGSIPSFYSPHSPQDYTRATPSPVYMGSPYAMQFPAHQLQHHQLQHPPPSQRPSYGGPGTTAYTMASQQAPALPHLVSAPPTFSGYPHTYAHPMLGISPEMNARVGYGSMYSQQFVPSPGAADSASAPHHGLGAGHSPGTAPTGHEIPTPAGFGGPPSAYSHSSSAHSTTAGGSTLSSPSHTAVRGPGRAASQPPPSGLVGHPYSTHLAQPSQSQNSPVAPSPHMAAFSAYNAQSSGSTYPYPYNAYAQTSPIQPQPYGQYPSPPLNPGLGHLEDPHPRPQLPRFQPHQGGTWWYVPPGGGVPQPFHSQNPQFEPQGPYTMNVPATVPENSSNRGSSFKNTGPPRGTSQRGQGPRRGPNFRGAAAAGRGRGGFQRPRGGGPTGAGLAAGSPSGGSGSHPTTSSDSANQGAPRTSALAANVMLTRKGKDPVRQPFHPKPQSHGHEWVMWVGNIPPNATQDEVWNFFRNPQAVVFYMETKQRQQWNGGQGQAHPSAGESSAAQAGEASSGGGVSSVFLIKSSCCAFVNFETEEALKRAVKIFNGIPLRPYDPDCLPLICRIRRKDDDLRSGVAAQRGWGLHTNWIRLQAEAMRKAGLVPETQPLRKSKEKKQGNGAEERNEAGEDTGEAADDDSAGRPGEVELGEPDIVVPPHLRSHEDPPTSPSTHIGPSSNSDPSPPIIARYERGGKRPAPKPHQSSSVSSGSYASTSSSFLAKFFPKRYFILKSLSEYDLNLSVERGIWATQLHNEPVLDQAFRSSQEVFLIFGVNRSGEFFGYARMTSGIGSADRRVQWANRADSGSASSRSAGSPGVSRQTPSYSVIVEDPAAEDGNPDPSSRPPSPKPIENPLLTPISGTLASSPSPMTPGQQADMPSPSAHHHSSNRAPAPKHKEFKSAPGDLGPPRVPISRAERAPLGETVDLPLRVAALSMSEAPSQEASPSPRLDPEAPIRAARRPELLESNDAAKAPLRPSTEPGQKPGGEAESHPPIFGRSTSDPQLQSWGTPFSVQWIKTERLPFVRVKNLRNPWNYNREVKVSRDGIELEPSVGEALLREWDKLEAERDAFQKLLVSRWYQKDGQWYQGDPPPPGASQGPATPNEAQPSRTS